MTFFDAALPIIVIGGFFVYEVFFKETARKCKKCGGTNIRLTDTETPTILVDRKVKNKEYTKDMRDNYISYTEKVHYVTEAKEGDKVYIYRCSDCGDEIRKDHMGW